MIRIDERRCTGCGLCASECIYGSLSIDGYAQFAGECMQCGHCEAICPAGAIRLDAPGYAYPAASIAGGDGADALLGFMERRRSVRQFTDEPVYPVQIAMLLEAGRYSPTASNRQRLGFIVLQERLPELRALAARELHADIERQSQSLSRALIQRIYDASLRGEDRLFFGAKAVIAIVDDAGRDIDGALAASRMELLANALGLGALINGIFVRAAKASGAINAALGIGEGRHIVTTLALGHPAVSFQRIPPRKAADVTWL